MDSHRRFARDQGGEARIRPGTENQGLDAAAEKYRTACRERLAEAKFVQALVEFSGGQVETFSQRTPKLYLTTSLSSVSLGSNRVPVSLPLRGIVSVAFFDLGVITNGTLLLSTVNSN